MCVIADGPELNEANYNFPQNMILVGRWYVIVSNMEKLMLDILEEAAPTPHPPPTPKTWVLKLKGLEDLMELH